jgi:hypothetical protein
MIVLVTDKLESWLTYIWEQFARINKLESEYQFFTYDQFMKINSQENRPLILEYSSYQKILQSLFIPKHNHFTADDYYWIRNDLPVYSGTFDERSKKFDIFFNAFVHLSRLEEWIFEKKGKRIYSYAFKHPRKNRKIWKIPVVNHLFNLLETEIKKKCHDISFGEKEKPIIQFSHDVDYIRKTIRLRIKENANYFINCATYFLHSEKKNVSLSKLKRGIKTTKGNVDYLFFDCWSELEDRFNIRPIYYLYARARSPKRRNAVQWFLDPSYEIIQDKKLVDRCHKLIFRGCEIGLHGSFFSAGDEMLFLKEKYLLEKIINNPVKKTRQHWLNYIETTTPFIHEKVGINTDSTIGFNDIPGFRSGVASIYNPYDHRNQKTFSFDEIPLVLMDAHIDDHVNCYDDFDWLFKCFSAVKKFEVSVDWHQRGFSADYQWSKSYETLCREYQNILSK